MKILLILGLLIVLIGCGTSTSSVEGRMISLSELSQTEWTPVSGECYHLLGANQDVIGMIEGGEFLLMLVTREQD